MEIANSNDKKDIMMDWDYLKDNVVPQLEDKIDVGKKIISIINALI